MTMIDPPETCTGNLHTFLVTDFDASLCSFLVQETFTTDVADKLGQANKGPWFRYTRPLYISLISFYRMIRYVHHTVLVCA